MKKAFKDKLNKFNNKGSALVVVIIVVSFICILGTLLLYLSVMNYQMKSTDYNTRVSFYGAEVPLEELRMQLAEDVSAASMKAYESVMMQYSKLNNAATREAEFQSVFFEEMLEIWNSRRSDPTDPSTWVGAVVGVLENNSSYHVITGAESVDKCADPACTCPYHIILIEEKDPISGVVLGERMEETTVTDAGGNLIVCMNFNDVKVTYTENSFYSEIITDFTISVPPCDWNLEAKVAYPSGWKNYQNEWVEGSSSVDRTKVAFEKCVSYLNYKKQ